MTLLLLLAIIVSFIWYDLRGAYYDALTYWDSNLSNSADEQESVETLWMNERRTDTVAMAHNDSVVAILLAQANHGNPTQRQQRVQQEVVSVATTNGFVGGAVGDRECRIVAQAGVPAEALAGVQRTCRIAQDTGDFKTMPFGANRPRVWLGMAFPVIAPGGPSMVGENSKRVLGAVVMLAEPWKGVFRFFAREGGPARSAETEIVWQESGEAVALSPARGKRGVESVIKLPLSGAAFESRVARESKEDFGQFTDSRGIAVFGVARPIGPAGASLVRKVDRDQALSEFHNRAWLEGLAGALSALLFGFVIAAQRRREVIRELREIQQTQWQRQQAEEALRQSDLRYKDFITHSIDGVWRVELEHPIPVDLPEEDALRWFLDYGYLAECNLAHARNMGFSSPDEILRRPLRAILPPQGVDQDRLESFRSAARGGWRSRTLEFRGFDNLGTARHLLRTEMPIIEGGSVVRIWGITRDITEIKRAEEEVRKSEARWRAVFENSAVGIGLGELPSARFLRANLALQQMLGYSEEELQALTFMEITHDDDREGNRRLLAELEAGRRESFAIQKRYWRKDGEAIWVNLHVSRVPGTETGSRVAMAIVEDISERKRAQENLQHSFEQLRALAAGLQRVREEERKSVAREIHDQLGQSLTAIKLDLSSLIEDFPTERSALSSKGLPILHLIDETIEAVRRISTELRPGMLDDLGLLATVEWATEEFEARTGTRCRIDLMPEEIATDPETATAVFRILQETLTNIARHAKASEVKVKISQEKGNLLLEVQDNGRGIDENELASSTSLGILGMRERAMLLGGTLAITGSPAKGTLVSLRIPRAAASTRKTS